MLTDDQILTFVGNHLQQSAGGNENDFVDSNRRAALAAYLGQKNGDEVEGKSGVVSTDVADAIEWIMPEIVKAFTQNNQVVTFDPVSPGDEEQARLESEYTYDVLMKDNNGFLVIHQFVKDALMQKNGFIKCFHSKDVVKSTEKYTGLTEAEYNMIIAKDGVEVVEETMEMYEEGEISIPTFDITIEITRTESCNNVVSVPPEEFRVSKMHNQVDLSTAQFSAHVMLKTASELILEGYDKDLIDSIPEANVYQDDREYRFYMQNETVYPSRNSSGDESVRQIEISECYLYIDVNQDGIAEFMKITVAGGDNPDVILDMEEIDENPFISATAILMSHKLFGLSIYDRLKEIQEQKTTLWRNIFDNLYLQNNQRTVVVKGQVELDDLLINRPGGIIRASRLDAVKPYATPPLDGAAYKMMDYLDVVRSGRSGVSPEGAVTDNMVGDRVGSEGVAKLLNQKEELVGLMVRVIAETGIKPLCVKIRDMLMKHQDTAADYKFGGKWVSINPTKWKSRKRTTVRVGTGSGNRQEQLSAVSNIMMFQEKLMANPGQALVNETAVFKALDDFARFSGMPGAEGYFIDPKSPEGQQERQKKDQSMQQQQQAELKEKQVIAEAQFKIANAEAQKAAAQEANVKLRNQVEQSKNQISAMDAQAKNEIKVLENQLKEAEAIISADQKDDELEYKYWQSREQFKVQREQIAATKQQGNINESND